MVSLRYVTAPIRNNNGKACAAISISGPVARLEGKRLKLTIEIVPRTAKEISYGLEYRVEQSSRSK